MNNELNNKVTQVQEAIQRERERREYAVIVAKPQRTYAICGISIPKYLEAYYAQTTCTVEHGHGIPCQWLDYAFLLPTGAWRIFLENDLLRSGMVMEQSIHAIFAELEVHLEDWVIEVAARTSAKTLQMTDATINHALEHPGAICAVYVPTSQFARELFANYLTALGQSVRSAPQSELVIRLVNDASIHFFWLTDLQRSRGYRFDTMEVVKNQ